jgi:hypothetical protein
VTAAAVAIRARAERIRVAVSPEVLALVGLGVLAATMAAFTWGTWGDLDSDTGYDIVAGIRVAHGELPYADFTYYYGPLSPFLSGLAALIGGDGFGPAIVLGLIITIALIGATYALARTFVGPLGSFLAAAFTAEVALIPNNYSFVLPHTYAATLGTLLLVLFILCLRRYSSSAAERWLAAAGALGGLLTLTKPEVTAAAFAAGVVWLALRAAGGARWHRELVLLAAPALAIPALVYGAFLTQVSAHRLFLENLYPSEVLKGGGNTLVKARMPLDIGRIAEVGGKLVLYAGGCALLLVIARSLEARGIRRLPLIAVGTALLAGVLAGVAQADRLREAFYYFYGWIPAGVVVALAVLLFRYRRKRGSELEAQMALPAAAALSVVAATTYAAFVTHGWRPQMAVYYIPLAAVFLVRLHLVDLARTRSGWALGLAWIVFLLATGTVLTLRDAHAESATVEGPGGTLAETPREAALYQEALGWIQNRTEPGDPILVAPIMTGLYPLSGREDVMREISLIPSALPSAADERAAITRLEAAGVRLAITDNRTWKGYGQTSFGDSFDRTLAGWIHHNFKHVATLRAGGSSPRALDVWTR